MKNREIEIEVLPEIPFRLRQAVTTGMAFLDALYPGHTDRVDLEALDLTDGYTCPLAQASGMRYPKALDHLSFLKGINLGWNEAGQYMPDVFGFCAHEIGDWELLTRAWKEAYTARLAAKS